MFNIVPFDVTNIQVILFENPNLLQAKLLVNKHLGNFSKEGKRKGRKGNFREKKKGKEVFFFPLILQIIPNFFSLRTSSNSIHKVLKFSKAFELAFGWVLISAIYSSFSHCSLEVFAKHVSL